MAKILAHEVKAGDFIKVTGFRTDASGLVCRVEVKNRWCDRAGSQQDYRFFHLRTDRHGNTVERELCSIPFGFLMTIERVGT